MTTLAPPTPLLVAARHALAAALADALRSHPAAPERSPWVGVASEAWDLLRDRHADLRRADLSLAEELPAEANPAHVDEWLNLPLDARRDALYAALGHSVSRDCPPYETEYCGSCDPFHRAQHMADLCGFFRAFAVTPDPAAPERLDHIANHLSFIALLHAKTAAALDETPGPQRDEHLAICLDAHRAFITDHAAEWIPTFAAALQRHVGRIAASAPVRTNASLCALAGVAHFLRAWIAVERIEAGVQPVRDLIRAAVEAPDPDADQCGLPDVCGGCDTVR
jgi:TorA maturation chaperone TorD